MSNPTTEYPGNSLDRKESTSELLGKTVQYVKKNYARVLPIFLLAGVLNGLVFVLFVNATTFPNIPPNLTNLTQVELLKIADQVGIATGYVWFEYFLSWLILYFATGVAIWQMSRAPLNPLAMNNDVNAGSPTTLNYAKLGLATFVSVLLVSLGLFLFLIGAVVLGVMLYLVLPVALLEDKSVGSAMSRSRQTCLRKADQNLRSLSRLAALRLHCFECLRWADQYSAAHDRDD